MFSRCSEGVEMGNKLESLVGKIGPSANEVALKGLVRVIAVVIVLSVVGFSDVMYLIVMQRIFPGGLFLVVCYIGAFAGFLATIYLLIGKVSVFAPGAQILISWIAFGAELLVASLNIILAFAGSSSQAGALAAWSSIAPATPIIHMFFVAIIYFADPSVKEKHKDMEMARKIRDAEREIELAQGLAKIGVAKKHLEFTVQELGNAITSEESLARIGEHAHSMNDKLLTDLTGKTVSDPYNARNDRGYGRR
jgi:hypothetical protein